MPHPVVGLKLKSFSVLGEQHNVLAAICKEAENIKVDEGHATFALRLKKASNKFCVHSGQRKNYNAAMESISLGGVFLLFISRWCL